MKPLTVASCDCGYATKPSSPAAAAYSLGRHSCAMQRERVARAQRRLDRLALSGPEQPCTHDDRHPHGHRNRYVTDKCRCRPCRDAASKYTRELERRHLYGRVIYVPAGPARAHVEALQAQGMGWKRIAARAGINDSVMWKLIYGDPSRNMAPSKRIRPTTEAAILGATLDLADRIGIPGTGTRRRLQGLVAVGWSQSKIAVRLGMTAANFGKVIHGPGHVRVATAKAVAQLYDELWNTQPPRAGHRDKIAYSRSVRYATLAGWVTPMAWDDDAIDNPDALPDLGEKVNSQGGRRISLEDVEWLLDQEPFTVGQIAERLHVHKSAVEHSCARNGRRDLLARMARNVLVREVA